MSENMNFVKLWGNAEKRRAFLEDYKAWGIWLTTPELDLTYYHYTLPDGTVIIAMEHNHRNYGGYQKGYTWDTSVRYYIKKSGEPFTPDSSSISAAAELLKAAKVQLQKKSGASG